MTLFTYETLPSDLRVAGGGDTISLADGTEIDVLTWTTGGKEYRAYAPPGNVWANTDNHVLVCPTARELRRVVAAGFTPCGCEECRRDHYDEERGR